MKAREETLTVGQWGDVLKYISTDELMRNEFLDCARAVVAEYVEAKRIDKTLKMGMALVFRSNDIHAPISDWVQVPFVEVPPYVHANIHKLIDDNLVMQGADSDTWYRAEQLISPDDLTKGI